MQFSNNFFNSKMPKYCPNFCPNNIRSGTGMKGRASGTDGQSYSGFGQPRAEVGRVGHSGIRAPEVALVNISMCVLASLDQDSI